MFSPGIEVCEYQTPTDLPADASLLLRVDHDPRRSFLKPHIVTVLNFNFSGGRLRVFHREGNQLISQTFNFVEKKTLLCAVNVG